MQVPHLSIYVTAKGELAMTHIHATGNPHEIETPLDFFDGRGFDSTITYLGKVVLGVMAHMYPEEMAKHPALHVPYDSTQDMQMLHYLISKSVTQRTSAFLTAIDALVDELSTRDPMVRTDTAIATWPEVRAMIGKHAREQSSS